MLRRPFFWFLFVLFCLSVAFFLYLQFFVSQPVEKIYQIELRPLENLPVAKGNSSISLEPVLSAAAAYAVDLDSMTVLYEKNAQESRYPASTSKLMTALVARKLFDLDESLRVSSQAATLAATTALPFRAGETLKVDQALEALLVSSHNASAFVLAEHDQAGFADFLKKMNQKAEELGLSSSHFVNPAGFDEDGQQSSARDLAILAKAVLADPYLAELVAQPDVTLVFRGQNISLSNTNELFSQVQGVKGVKTGTTDLAGEVLVSFIERDGQRILLVLMGSSDRYADTKNLLAWILNNYQWRNYQGLLETSNLQQATLAL